MKAATLLKAVNDIQDSFIEEAAPKGTLSEQKTLFRLSPQLLVMAAVLLVAVITGISHFREPQVTVVSPYVSCQTMQEAAEITGFALTVPDQYEGSSDTSIAVYNGNLLEISFLDEEGNELLSIRKAPGNDDISGDYNAYEQQKTLTVADRTITLKGNDGLYNLALWQDHGFSYSITGQAGLTEDNLTALALEVD